MRALELVGISRALEHSEQNREETIAARRKYREEQSARILQLFAPVRLVSFRSDVTWASWGTDRSDMKDSHHFVIFRVSRF
jgi:hypothetical protein